MWWNSCKITNLVLVLLGIITGTHNVLVVAPTGNTLINALAGTNVTLGISYTGATDPLLSWVLGTLILVTWAVGGSPPDIASTYRSVLSVDPTGSLVFRNVPVSYSGTYTVHLVKSGVHEVSLNFTLLVYDLITGVSVDAGTQDAMEHSAFTLSYSYTQGPAFTSKWYFNGLELADGSRYSITQKRLVINQLSRNDTGLYGVVLTNPFSSATQTKNVVVLYGPDQPVLEVSPSKASFSSGEVVSLSCRANGEPTPSASWLFKDQALPTSPEGTVHLTNLQTSQSGVYTCVLVNGKTEVRLTRNVTIDVQGLSRSAIAALAAGVPCGIFLLLLIAGLILLCYCCYKKKDRNPKYPVARAVEKVVNNQRDLTRPHKPLNPGLKQPPAYDLHRHQVLGERSGPLPLAVPPVRQATTV